MLIQRNTEHEARTHTGWGANLSHAVKFIPTGNLGIEVGGNKRTWRECDAPQTHTIPFGIDSELIKGPISFHMLQ